MFSRIHFQTIGAIDPARARDFYRDRLGLTVRRDEAYGDSRWIFMEIPGAGTLLHFDQVAEIAPQQKPALVLVTDDTDAACATLQACGVTIHQGPADAPWSPGTRWAMIHDSEGNLILIQTVKD